MMVVDVLEGEKSKAARKEILIHTQRRVDVHPDVSEGKVRYEEDL